MIVNPISRYLMIGKLIALLGTLALICYQSEQIHKWHKQASGLAQTIEQLARESKVQQVQTTRIVDRYITVTKPVVRKQVELIEAAPLPGNCKTPKEILDADV